MLRLPGTVATSRPESLHEGIYIDCGVRRPKIQGESGNGNTDTATFDMGDLVVGMILTRQ